MKLTTPFTKAIKLKQYIENPTTFPDRKQVEIDFDIVYPLHFPLWITSCINSNKTFLIWITEGIKHKDMHRSREGLFSIYHLFLFWINERNKNKNAITICFIDVNWFDKQLACIFQYQKELFDKMSVVAVLTYLIST